ncbi:MAG: hypothetical protein P1U86_00720 [Verrucomicrobiales bacterium]|nr:hypothetical protein [Verrucomicrobiales bacterium]
MFRRVILESWHDYVPYVCFALIGGAFIMILIRVFTMSKDDVDRISHIPLEDNTDNHTER